MWNPIYSLHYIHIGNNYATAGNIGLVGHTLYNHWYGAVAISGLILLVAMVGSIVLTVDFCYHDVSFVVTYNTTELLENKIKYINYLPIDRRNKHIFYYDDPK